MKVTTKDTGKEICVYLDGKLLASVPYVVGSDESRQLAYQVARPVVAQCVLSGAELETRK